MFKDTAIYGLSSILGKFMNWLLVPLYTYVITVQAEYGIVVNLYGWLALVLVFLTYGMETGFFRFSKKHSDFEQVYSTSFFSILTTSVIFVLLTYFFNEPISKVLDLGSNNKILIYCAVILFFDAISTIPFVYLRQQNRPVRFAVIKLVNIGLNIFLNLFFLIVLPKYFVNSFIFKSLSFVDFIFLANIATSVLTFLMLIPYLNVSKSKFDFNLLKSMLSYSFPILVVGIAGGITQYGDKIIYPYLYNNQDMAYHQLGIYGACYKLAVVMVMFVQAFRFAYEPFFFSKNSDKNDRLLYSKIMNIFVALCLFVFLGMTFFVDVIKYFIGVNYQEGLYILPIILLANIFYGVYFNLSVWYKVTDKTRYGAYLAIVGSMITLCLNIIFVPKYGYIASAWANFVCFGVMMILSWVFSLKHFRVDYELSKLGILFVMAILMFYADKFLVIHTNVYLAYILKILFLFIFTVYYLYTDGYIKKFVSNKF